MEGICPNCKKESEIELVRTREVIEVRGESIEVDAEFFICTECGADFENTRWPDSLLLAYKEHRNRCNMFYPEKS